MSQALFERRYSALFVLNAITWAAMLTFWLTARVIHSTNPDGNPTGQEQIWFMLDGMDAAIHQAVDRNAAADLEELCLKRRQYAAGMSGSAYKPEPDVCKPSENQP